MIRSVDDIVFAELEELTPDYFENNQKEKPKNLFETQKKYLLENKDRIFGEYCHTKIGFDLNIMPHFWYLIEFELRKVFSDVHDEIFTERFLTENFNDILDAVWSKEGDDFSIKEAMKSEAKLSLISHYIRSIRNQKVYPSQIIRKERVINNSWERAKKVIDNYFSEKDIRFSEISDIIDIFETCVFDYGRHVDFHFGRSGFTLSEEHSASDMLSYVSKERSKMQAKFDLYEKEIQKVNQLKEKISSLDLVAIKQMEEFDLFSSSNLGISNYDIRTSEVEEIENKINGIHSGLEVLYNFLLRVKEFDITITQNSRFDIVTNTLFIDQFKFDYKNKTPEEFKLEFSNYLKVKDFLQTINDALTINELRSNITFKDNMVYLNASFTNKHPNNREVAGLYESFAKRSKQNVRIIFHVKDGILYRQTWEQVLTPEVVIFEVMEKIRTNSMEYVNSVEKAKEMFVSVLSEKEEQLLKKENITILEGENNFYAILANQSYNNVVKIPKEFKSEKDIKALCIHPSDYTVPKHDGFAAIALSIKSGDEEYVLENSNEFKLANNIKEKVMNVFHSFVSKPMAVNY